jgi:hypothetical protein
MGTRVSAQDKRRAIRLRVNGAVRGRLASGQPLDLHDLSSGGFLAEMTTRLPEGSAHDVVLTSGSGLVVNARARCAHVRRHAERASTFRVGFAFLSVRDDEIEALLDLLMGDLSFS